MPFAPAAPNKSSSWPMSVGAEAIAAAQFARCGFDVLVQAGHDKPWYDLAVTKAGNLLKIAVKASEDGCWHLVQSYPRRGTHPGDKKAEAGAAVDFWVDMHASRTIYCLVQFEGVSLNELPRIYLASPAEIAMKMRETVERLGDPTLREQYQWAAAETGFTCFEALPSGWLFSPRRIEELLFTEWPRPIALPQVHKHHVTVEMPSKSAELTREDMREAVLSA